VALGEVGRRGSPEFRRSGGRGRPGTGGGQPGGRLGSIPALTRAEAAPVGQILWDVTVNTIYVHLINFLAPRSRDMFDATNMVVDYLFCGMG
jgi:hypothetical protein